MDKTQDSLLCAELEALILLQMVLLLVTECYSPKSKYLTFNILHVNSHFQILYLFTRNR